MTTDQFIKNLEKKIQTLKSGKALAIAAQDTHVKMVERIFEDMTDAEGKKRPYNTTDPIYVSPATSPKDFPTKGKNGKETFKDGRPHMTGYFESYKAYRDAIGKKNKYVNLNLWGILESDFRKGFIKIDNETYASTVTNQGNTEKTKAFSKYFEISKDERINFRDVLEDETLKILR